MPSKLEKRRIIFLVESLEAPPMHVGPGLPF